jgi:hypothetical protein
MLEQAPVFLDHHLHVIAGLDPAMHLTKKMDARGASAFTRVHSPSKTGVSALREALCPRMTVDGLPSNATEIRF